MDQIIQGITTILTATSIGILSSKKSSISRWGFVVGFVAQIFWTIVYIRSNQLTFLFLDVWYFICYVRGIINNFRGEK